MLTVLWSVKGGVGVSVAAASMAKASSSAVGTVLIDFGGDQPAILGIAEPSEPTLAEWVASPADVALDSLRRIETPVAPNLALLRGGNDRDLGVKPERLQVALRLLSVAERHVVIDLGRLGDEPLPLDSTVFSTLTSGDRSLLVTSPCYLALRRAQQVAHRATGVVLVDDPGRALRAGDVEAALPTPLVATIPHLPAISRSVDAGMLLGRFPSSLRRALRDIA